MRPLQHYSIKSKLLIITALVCAIALLASCAAFTLHDVRSTKKSRAEQLSALANVTAAAVAAALRDGDAIAARRAVEALRAEPSIESAELFDALDRPLARLSRRGDRATWEGRWSAEQGVVWNGDCLHATCPVVVDGVLAGTLRLSANTSGATWQFVRSLGISLVVFVWSLAIAMPLAGWLQRALTQPILRLAGAMSRVSSEHNYRLRIEAQGSDELAVLCLGFNRMLDQIEAARRELQCAHDEMEARVRRRTEELSAANEFLAMEVTQRERAAHDLRLAKNAAEAASRAKSDFLANMSHEIRTPMTAIMGFADLLQDADVPDRQRAEHVQTIRRSGDHLLSVINDILDVSKIEAGKMTLERVPCATCRIVGEAASVMQAKAAAKGLKLSVEFATPVPETVQSDPTRLRQILMNLVSNAVKFTDRGEVKLIVGCIDDGGRGRLTFEIVDTGPGLTAEQAAQLFQPFTQGDNSMTRRFGGTGLGLVISKRFAELLGGDVTVASEPGRGSRFLATIDAGPLAGVRMACGRADDSAPSATPPTMRTAWALAGNVLLAEDGFDNQRLICLLLRKAGLHVHVVENGELACRAALAAADANDPFDLILMDMQMPVLDGYSAARRLRELDYRGPIVALTAHAMLGDRARCLEAGCDDYATKPIDRETLLTIVARYCPARERKAAGESLNATAWPSIESPPG